MSMFKDVGEFHHKFGLPKAGDGAVCRLPDFVTLDYRTRFLDEELEEFKLACAQGSLSKACDALIDLAWVALGTLHYFRAPGDELWAEVRRANMEKCRADELPCSCKVGPGQVAVETDCLKHGHKRGAAESIRKPPGWTPPDILKVVREHNVRMKRVTVNLGGQNFVGRLLGLAGTPLELPMPQLWPRPPAPMFDYNVIGSPPRIYQTAWHQEQDLWSWHLQIVSAELAPSGLRVAGSVERKHPLGCGCDICDPYFDPSN